jgi:4-hydroxybenzoate polyprenyltransferase
MFYAMRHLLRRNRLFFVPGEIFVLLLYLSGTWLGPIVARSVPFQSGQVLILVMMAGVLMMNLGIISLYDVRLDTRLGISSMAMVLGKKVTRNLMIATSAGIFILAILQFLVHGTDSTFSLALILSGMAALLLMVLLFPSRFRKEEAYRLVSDGVLLMGFLSLMVSFRGP